MPHVALKIIVVVRDLHVRSDLGMELFRGKSDPVYINDTFRNSSRRSDGHSGHIRGTFLQVLVSVMAIRGQHVFILYPCGTPSLEVHVEIEMADLLIIPVQESKGKRGIHRNSIVNPDHQSGPVHLHGSLDVRTVVESQCSLAFP